MEYHVEINGKWYKVTKEKAEELIEQGVIKRETRMRDGDKIGSAGKFLYFSPTAGKRSESGTSPEIKYSLEENSPKDPAVVWRKEKPMSPLVSYLKSWWRFIIKLGYCLIILAILFVLIKIYAPSLLRIKNDIQNNAPKTQQTQTSRPGTR